ncbi:cadmium resistance transporter [Liquorilactobacillus sicerae]|uniref:cadmium resistance transporter n=1 Tax=Liquorilactobacillus sicerae TaxID=1416943 RepID=UPI0024806E82|nr:cadmium resistance transporter [Liquorilactobacillus sicerae]
MNYWILLLTFLAVNLDFFLILLFLLTKYRTGSVILGYSLGNFILLSLSYFLSKLLTNFLPLWLLGCFGGLPIYLALRTDDDNNEIHEQKSPILTTLVTYLSVCSSCNLAIFLPVLVGKSFSEFMSALLLICLLAGLVVILIKLIAKSSFVTRLIQRFGENLMKVCYIVVGCYVFWDSGLISHLLAFL